MKISLRALFAVPFLLCLVHYNTVCSKSIHRTPKKHGGGRRKHEVSHKPGKYREAEYDITLRSDEMRDYLAQFNGQPESSMPDLEEDISQRVGVKKTLSSMLSDPALSSRFDERKRMDEQTDNLQDGMNRNFGQKQTIPVEAALNSPVFPPVFPQRFNLDAPSPPGGGLYSQQRNAAQYGQQPQMNIRMPGEIDSARMNRENDDIIQSAAQDKINFMEKAIGGPDIPSRFENMPMQGDSGHHRNGDMYSSPQGINAYPNSAVTESDIAKAEGIQPNEMSDLNSFLEDSNRMNSRTTSQEAEMLDGKFLPAPNNHFAEDVSSPLGFHGGDDHEFHDEHDMIGLHHMARGNHGSFHDDSAFHPSFNSPIGDNGNGLQDTEGGRVFTGDPSVDFVEESTRKMMSSNSDYQVPGTAFGALWKNFLTSTQSQLGLNDPSANSREGIERLDPIVGAIKHGNIERSEDDSEKEAKSSKKSRASSSGRVKKTKKPSTGADLVVKREKKSNGHQKKRL